MKKGNSCHICKYRMHVHCMLRFVQKKEVGTYNFFFSLRGFLVTVCLLGSFVCVSMSEKHLSESVKKGIHRHVYMMMMGMNKQFVRTVPFHNETSVDERALFLVSFLEWHRYKMMIRWYMCVYCLQCF